MYVKLCLLIFILLSTNITVAQLTPFERMGKNYTATYTECIAYYKQLQKSYKGIKVVEQGGTDAGIPLHTILLDASMQFNPQVWQQQNKCVLLINNGIHPGEPDGIDASMMLARSVLQQIKKGTFSKNICIAIIPVYNIGGCLNRSEFYRVDQNGPHEFGSRGNSANLDLNRDFIKCDSKEAMSFARIFNWLQPHIFIDNHVSDGANYPYVLTLASTQKDKLGGVLKQLLTQKMEPAIFDRMSKLGTPMIPYVNVWGRDAKEGWAQFFDSPRYSSGYAALWNTIGFIVETHMLKPYDQRVYATLSVMNTIIDYIVNNSQSIVQAKRQAQSDMLAQSNFDIAWQNLRDSATYFTYNGYAYKTRISEVSGLPVAYYDTNETYQTQIPFYNFYKATQTVSAPSAYIIPQGWHKVIHLLANAGVKMQTLKRDTTINVQLYRIVKYQSSATPYEGHHANRETQVEVFTKQVNYRKGDIIINVQQPAKRFLIEVLEPHAMDSYFSWNYFDAILIQKEGFTDYAYEDKAAEYLRAHPQLKQQLEAKRLSDTSFAKDSYAQLEFVFKNSPYYEPQHNVYPVARIALSNSATSKPQVGKPIQNKVDE